jgi:hypothetical protein
MKEVFFAAGLALAIALATSGQAIDFSKKALQSERSRS